MKRLSRQDEKIYPPGIVHFGPGAFFRAFLVPYTQEAMVAKGGDWGITAVSLNSRSAYDQLHPQGGVYFGASLSGDNIQPEKMTAISCVMLARNDPSAVVHLLASPSTHIVSLTITEKGYAHHPSEGILNTAEAGIAHDLAHIDAPQTAIGFIVAGLQQRYGQGLPPFTVLSCDNLPSNGQLTRRLVLQFAELLDHELAAWIAEEGCFPSTMVDRITPATTEADLARIAKKTGVLDHAAVVYEPFRQWVIEDNFVGDRPYWQAGGAQFVCNVNDHELMKLRALNGTHSALAYLGYLAGYRTIFEATSTPDFAAFCQKLWQEEIVPTLTPPEGEDLKLYCAALLARYQNPAIQHKTWQIAMDGSQKLPQRILATIDDGLEIGIHPKGLCLVVAGWMRYIEGIDEAGNVIDVRDPMADALRACFDQSNPIESLLSISSIFPAHLARHPDFRTTLEHAYAKIKQTSVAQTIKEYINDKPD